MQSAYARAYASWRRVSSADHPEAYVRRMVVNEVLSTRRRGWWKRERPHDAPEPTSTADSPEDAQLTYDGKHVLYWSSTLEPIAGGSPITLDQGETGRGTRYGWWAVDTDGSILAAVPGKGSTSTVYDCEVPSGHCEELGPLQTLHGDPLFIGVDM